AVGDQPAERFAARGAGQTQTRRLLDVAQAGPGREGALDDLLTEGQVSPVAGTHPSSVYIGPPPRERSLYQSGCLEPICIQVAGVASPGAPAGSRGDDCGRRREVLRSAGVLGRGSPTGSSPGPSGTAGRTRCPPERRGPPS